jgi:hypothetical protein
MHPAATAVMLRNIIQRLKILKIEGAEGKYRAFVLFLSFPASGSRRMPTRSIGICRACGSMAIFECLPTFELEIIFMYLAI